MEIIAESLAESRKKGQRTAAEQDRSLEAILSESTVGAKMTVAPLAHRTVRCTPDSPVNFSGAAAARTRG